MMLHSKSSKERTRRRASCGHVTEAISAIPGDGSYTRLFAREISRVDILYPSLMAVARSFGPGPKIPLLSTSGPLPLVRRMIGGLVRLILPQAVPVANQWTVLKERTSLNGGFQILKVKSVINSESEPI